MINTTQRNKAADDIILEVKKVIRGKDEVIRMVLAAILAGGHVLLEDIPGVGKTTLALAFSRALSLSYRRVQFTPDVLPGDLLGFKMYDQSTGAFRFEEGSIYTNLFLADEINRTSPKTQSALLEVMEERQVTVEGEMRAVPQPFFVIATENPFGSAGTQRLPESQLDRFLVRLSMGYPAHDAALEVLKGSAAHTLDTVRAVTDAERLLSMQQAVEAVFVDESLYEYVLALTEATRDPARFALGLSPRGSIALLKTAKANAFLSGRDFLTPEDIHEALLPVAVHRVHLNARERAKNDDLPTALKTVLSETPIPKVS